MIYFAFVYSRLCHGSEIYGNTYQTHLSKLHILNNKKQKILQNKPRHTHVIELYKTYNNNTIHEIHKLQILVLVHKFFHHKMKLPTIFNSYFNINKSFYHHNTCGGTAYISTAAIPELAQDSIKY